MPKKMSRMDAARALAKKNMAKNRATPQACIRYALNLMEKGTYPRLDWMAREFGTTRVAIAELLTTEQLARLKKQAVARGIADSTLMVNDLRTQTRKALKLIKKRA